MGLGLRFVLTGAKRVVDSRAMYAQVVVTDDVPAGYLPKQNTRKEVYDFIVNDLITNIPKVSQDNSTATYGKFNKWAGLALLAKMYLNAEYYTGIARYQGL